MVYHRTILDYRNRKAPDFSGAFRLLWMLLDCEMVEQTALDRNSVSDPYQPRNTLKTKGFI